MMSALWKANFWSNTCSLSKVAKSVTSRLYSGLLCHADLRPSVFLCDQVVNFTHHPVHHFHCTPQVKLKTLFTEDEQKKIACFLNELKPDQQSWTGKFRLLNKLTASIQKNGPVSNVNDLLEKYSMSTSSAVNLCNAILNSSGVPADFFEEHRPKRKVALPRKVTNLMRSVYPSIRNPKSINKFTALTLTETHVSYAVFKNQNSNWESQQMIDWNVTCLEQVSPFESIFQLRRLIPPDEQYVVHMLSSKGGGYLKQAKTFGILLSVICAKNNFENNNPQFIIELGGRAPAHYFNLIIGNECVSPLNIVSNHFDKDRASLEDNHVLSRSLAEVTFADDAVVRFKNFNDTFQESLCHSLLLSKALIDILKVI